LKTVDKLIIESQLAIKGRATIVIGILLHYSLIWRGLLPPLQFAVLFLGRGTSTHMLLTLGHAFIAKFFTKGYRIV